MGAKRRRRSIAHVNVALGSAALVVALTVWPAAYSSWTPQHDLGFSPRALLFASLFVGSTLVWGILPLAAVPSAARVWSLPLLLITGSSLVGAGLLLVRWLELCGAAQALLALFLVGAFVALIAARPFPRILLPLRRTSRVEVMVVVVSLLTASVQSRAHLSGFVREYDRAIYEPWSDGFALARVVAQFSSPSLEQLPRPNGPVGIAGMEPVFYHYGSYAAAGAFAGLTHAPALTAIDAFAMPWSMLLMALAAYVLGRRWWGERGAWLALAAAMFLPDASHYGFESAWFGYYWLLLTSPSLPWGVALAGVSVVVTYQACRRGELALLALGFLVALGTVIFKAHIAVLLLPTLFVFSAFHFSGIRARSRLLLSVSLCVLFGATSTMAAKLNLAPTLAAGEDWGATYSRAIARYVPGDTARELWINASVQHGLVSRVALLLAGSFGALALFYFVVVLIRRATGREEAHDLLPLTLLAIHLGVALVLAPNANGNRWELHHRPFVLVFFVLAVWCGGALATLRLGAGARWEKSHPWLLGLLIVLGSPLVWNPEWAGSHPLFIANLATPLRNDYLACVDSIREHSHPDDVIQSSGNDPMRITTGLTELMPHLASPTRVARAPRYAGLAERRLSELEALTRVTTKEHFIQAVRDLPIRWYLLEPDSENGVSWPPEVKDASRFRCGAFRVYDLDAWRSDPPGVAHR